MEIVELFETSGELGALHLRYGDTVLDLQKPGTESASLKDTQAPPAQPSAEAAPAPQPKKPAAQIPAGAFQIKSPSVGTFYQAPEPGATPFVSVGQKVTPATTVCIIEIMKVMNALQAGCSGTVSQILVENEEMVEYDQCLIVIDPDQEQPAR